MLVVKRIVQKQLINTVRQSLKQFKINTRNSLEAEIIPSRFLSAAAMSLPAVTDVIPSGDEKKVEPKSNASCAQEKTSSASRKRKNLDSPNSVDKPKKKSDESASQTTASSENHFSSHPELLLSHQLIYEPCGLVCTSKPVKEAESAEYGAFDFSLNQIAIKFRVAKTTPTKNGQFVTLWKRIGRGPIMPYDTADPVDLFVICVREGKNVGQFVFPKSVLASEDIVSRGGKGGKRAIRVYAPWVKAESSQASKTKSWQIKYFVNLSEHAEKFNLDRVRKLYASK